MSSALLYGVALVSGTAFVFFNIAQVAALPRVVSRAQLPQANALNASAESAVTLIGPGLAGFIISLARTTVTGAILAYLLDSLTLPIDNVAVISYRLALTPDALQGRVNSVARLLALAGLPAGAAIGGVLLGPLGPRTELWLVALGIGVSALAVSGTGLCRA